jgi:hypothetical protein
MVLCNYTLMAQDKQLDFVMRKGAHLLATRRYNMIINLFAADNFYVEVISHEKSGEIITINAFDDMEYLEPYLQKVDVSEVLRK